MQVLRWPERRSPLSGCSVATLGVFDGVHRGHAQVIGRVVAAARERGCLAALATFDRHPAGVLQHRLEPAITSLDHRIRLFAAHGLDVCVVVQFTEEVAQMPAERFAREVFGDLLRARLLVLGFDSRFGRDREGDVELCRRLGFEVVSVPPVEVDGRPVSSTAIRQAVMTGDLARAERLLGRPFSLYGTVVRGAARGRRLGFPTANLDLHNETVPPDGVYATWLFADGGPLPSVTSVGRQPTFPDAHLAESLVEVHAIGRDLDAYGQDVEVQFVRKLRDQIAYADVEALKAQIQRDIEDARRVLGK